MSELSNTPINLLNMFDIDQGMEQSANEIAEFLMNGIDQLEQENAALKASIAELENPWVSVNDGNSHNLKTGNHCVWMYFKAGTQMVEGIFNTALKRFMYEDYRTAFPDLYQLRIRPSLPSNPSESPNSSKERVMSEYKGVICRGCWSFGTACGHCEKCKATRPKGENIKHFTMSKFSTKEDMFKARAEYFERQLSEAQKELEASRLECEALKQSNKKVIMDAVDKCKSNNSRICGGNTWEAKEFCYVKDLIEYANNKET